MILPFPRRFINETLFTLPLRAGIAYLLVLAVITNHGIFWYEN